MKKVLRTKLEYRCEKSREFNYGLCDWYTRYSRSYDMIVTTSTEEDCQRVMDSFEDKIRYYNIQESFDGNLRPEFDEKKKLWVGLVEIWIDNNSVAEDKELIKDLYKEWKEELKNNKEEKVESKMDKKVTIESIMETSYEDGTVWIEYKVNGMYGYEISDELNEGDEEMMQSWIDDKKFSTKNMTNKPSLNICSKELAELIEECRQSENEMWYIDEDEEIDEATIDALINEVKELGLEDYIKFHEYGFKVTVYGGVITQLLFPPYVEEKNNVEYLIKEIKTLSSGTILSIAREAGMVSNRANWLEVEALEEEWIAFVENSKDTSDNWKQSWKKFAKHKDDLLEAWIEDREIESLIEPKKEERKEENIMEKGIKSRTTTQDVLNELIRKESNGDWCLDYYIDTTGEGSAVLNRKTTVVFKMDADYKIEVIGGDRIAYGDWYDLELDDEHLIESGKKLQAVLNLIKEKNPTLSHDGVYRVYPVEASAIIEKRDILGKFYEYDTTGKWVGIDNEDGEAWTEDFESLQDCINWLLDIDEKKYSCYNCGEIEESEVSISIEFADGEVYHDLIGSYESEEEILEYIRELIEEKNWKDEVTDFSYGHFCPCCLESLE